MLSRRCVRVLTSNVKIFISSTTNPFENLSLENWLFNEANADHTLFLWRNEPSVIIGKYQNPWKECNVKKLEEAGVHVVRRHSGGGTVYQDLGNSIFSFINPKERSFDWTENFNVLVNALQTRGITAEVSGRNDMLLASNKCKISGSAFKVGAKSNLHHGTLLLNVDLDAMTQYLHPNKLKLQSKGIASVRSRVANLVTVKPDITHEDVCEAIWKQYQKKYNSTVEPVLLSPSDAQGSPAYDDYHDQLCDWDFRFGKTPSFTHEMEVRFDWATIEVLLNVNNAVITNATIYTDCLYPVWVEMAAEALKGCRYTAAEVNKTMAVLEAQLEDVPGSEPFRGYCKPFGEWLGKCVA
eukprot:TRINITY_DN53905_c0_g1_i1.p1 TRINITY_DN53905_c0_g1~~TRINITY_DN53905_c0_g1_i1.p1  ORF type:complete len:353 (+),score=31.91 TRINITY_DN53905_c0_g1_i1:68-1126(+)